MKLKASYKNKQIECRMKSGDDLVKTTLPAVAVEEILRTDTDQAEDGPAGWEYRIGAFCFPKKLFTDAGGK